MPRTIAKIALLIIFTAWPLKAEILGVASMTATYRMRQLEPHYGSVVLSVFDVDPIFVIFSGVHLFGDVVLDSSCVDTTFIATVLTEGSDFGDAARRLTDGTRTYIGIGFIPTYSPQVVFLTPVQTRFALETDDFEGATIESISLRLDELSFLDFDGVTWVTVGGTITIEGIGNADPVEQTTWGNLKILYHDG